MSYSTKDAITAFFKLHTDQGLDERQVMQPSAAGFDADDGYRLVHRDADGRVDFRVAFDDTGGGYGDAMVTIVGDPGASGHVNIFERGDGQERCEMAEKETFKRRHLTQPESSMLTALIFDCGPAEVLTKIGSILGGWIEDNAAAESLAGQLQDVGHEAQARSIRDTMRL